jgi:hypothetical protein
MMSWNIFVSVYWKIKIYSKNIEIIFYFYEICNIYFKCDSNFELCLWTM